MYDIFDIMKYLAILASIFITYIYLFHLKVQRQNGFYKNQDWNYIFKYWIAKHQLNKIKIKQKKYVNSMLLQKSECPLLLKTDKSSDTLSFYGTDQNKNSIILRMTRLRHRTADVWIVLRLANGTVWTLPEHPDVRIHEVIPGQFSTISGLEFNCLDSFSRWQIRYSGFLRNKIRNEYSNDIAEHELKYVTFHFLFTASNNALFWPLDWSSSLMASGIATENWKNGKWPEVLNIPGNIGYDQFGEIFGQVKVESEEIIELHLPGIRQRFWESTYNFNLRRFISIIGVTRTGCIFTIGAKSFTENLSHVQFGNVRLPNGEIYSIDWTDFKIPKFAEIEKSLPNEYSINFRAGKYKFHAVINFSNENQIRLLQGNPFSWKVISIPITFLLDGNLTQGFGITNAWFPYTQNSTKPIPIVPKKYMKLIYNNSLPNRSKLTLSFMDYEASSKIVSGGKGASLALLSNIINENYMECNEKFLMPEGFIISVAAFRLFFAENPDIYLELRNLEDICFRKINEDLKKCCEKIVEMIKISVLNEETIRSIQKSLIQLKCYGTDLSFAIRSSAVDEDGDELSSAGQNDSFLGIKNLEEILHYVKMCWASLYSVKSVEYRRNNAKSILTEMAVIVQIVIPSETSGVLFTNHSISEKCASIVITANYGLGLSVVSAVVDPDTYIISRNHNTTSLKIEDIFIGKKSHLILLKETGGTTIISRESTNSKSTNSTTNLILCINNDMILKLSKIGIMLERMFCSPQDIEWAIYKDEIYLLQSRPITTYQKFSDWECLHEFDSPLMSTKEVLTRGNIGESYVGPIDHLTQSIFIKARTAALEREFNIKKYDKLTPSFGLKLSHNQVFIDVITIFNKAFENTKLNAIQRAAGYSILGSLNITPEIISASIDHSGFMANSRIWKSYTNILPCVWKSSNVEKEFKKFIKVIKTFYTDERMKSHQNTFNAYKDLEELIDKHLKYAIDSHIVISKAYGLLQMFALILILNGNNELTIDHLNDVMRIMTGEKDIISAQIPKEIKEIADSIYISNANTLFRQSDPSLGAKWLELYAPAAFRQFKQFLRTYGHRGFNEFNLSSKTWEMNPELVIKMIQDNLKENISLNGAVHYNNSLETIINKLNTPNSKIIKFILKFIIPCCRNSVKRRENSKNLLVIFVSIMRKHFINLSKLLCNEGLLPEPELIFYLVRSELKQLITTRNTECVRKAIRRRKLFNNWYNIKFPDLIIGIPKPINKNDNKFYEFYDNEKINGLPVQCGCIEGRACVIKTISEVEKIKNGDILVTYSTDIAWSPYFPMLGGLVTELGGLISHGAIVAREYGLPCIVGAQNATEIIKFGDNILLNADKGFVTKAIV